MAKKPSTEQERLHRNAMQRARTANNRAIINQRARLARARKKARRLIDPAFDAHERGLNREAARRFFFKHREKVNARNRQRLIDDPSKRRSIRNPVDTAAYDRAYHANNRDKINARSRQRYADDPTKRLANAKKRNALRRGATGSDLTSAQWETIKAHYNFRCVYCKPNCWRCTRKCHALTQDHLTPVSGGGPDTLQNVVPACRSCNAKKGNGKVLKPVQPMLL